MAVSQFAEVEDSVDDEWEYEYDVNETEEFYVTIDLSGAPAAGRPVVKARSKSANGTRKLPEDGAANDDTPEILPSIEGGNVIHDPSTDETMQILELHSRNPIISHRGRLLTGEWAGSVGSDLVFSRYSGAPDSGHTPLRPMSNYDLVAVNSARLIATNAQLRPRKDEELPPESPEPDSVEDPEPTASSTARATSPKGKIWTAETRTDTTSSKKRQADFIERYREAKRKRGEGPWVPATAWTGYQPEHEIVDEPGMPRQIPDAAPPRMPREGQALAESQVKTPPGFRKTTKQGTSRGSGRGGRPPGRPRGRAGRPRGSRARGKVTGISQLMASPQIQKALQITSEEGTPSCWPESQFGEAKTTADTTTGANGPEQAPAENTTLHNRQENQDPAIPSSKGGVQKDTSHTPASSAADTTTSQNELPDTTRSSASNSTAGIQHEELSTPVTSAGQATARNQQEEFDSHASSAIDTAEVEEDGA